MSLSEVEYRPPPRRDEVARARRAPPADAGDAEGLSHLEIAIDPDESPEAHLRRTELREHARALGESPSRAPHPGALLRRRADHGGDWRHHRCLRVARIPTAIAGAFTVARELRAIARPRGVAVPSTSTSPSGSRRDPRDCLVKTSSRLRFGRIGARWNCAQACTRGYAARRALREIEACPTFALGYRTVNVDVSTVALTNRSASKKGKKARPSENSSGKCFKLPKCVDRV